MFARGLAAAMVVIVSVFGVASATSLGTFDDVALDALRDDKTPCTYDSVTLLDGTLDLLTGTILGSSELDTIELTNVAGDCVGTTPVVVLQGIDLLDLTAGEQVLQVIDGLEPLASTGDLTIRPDPSVPLVDDIDLREVRVAFCPPSHACG